MCKLQKGTEMQKAANGTAKGRKTQEQDGKREDKRHATANAEACGTCIYKGETAHKKSDEALKKVSNVTRRYFRHDITHKSELTLLNDKIAGKLLTFNTNRKLY